MNCRVILLFLFVGVAVSAPPTVTVPLDPLSVAVPIRVRLFGAFSAGWAVRLARNVSDCDSAATFSGIYDIPRSTVSNIVRWTLDDSPSAWVVKLVAKEPGNNARVCWTSDNGAHWNLGLTKEHANGFKIWKKVPTAVAVPQTVTVGSLMRVFVFDGLLQRFARAVLVANATSCTGSFPRGALTPVTNIKGGSFEFRPRKSVSSALLCVSMKPFNVWSVIPFDPNNEIVYKSPEHIRTNFEPRSIGITIHPKDVKYRRANVSCGPLVAGAAVTCFIEITNKTLITFSSSQLQIASLTDGSGNVECPLPLIRQVSPTRAAFSFTPQGSGREGSLSFLFKGTPLIISANNSTNAYYAFNRKVAVPNITIRYEDVVEWYTRDASVMKFQVQPTFTFLKKYSFANLLSLLSFNIAGNWVTQYGVYRFAGRKDGTVNGDMQAVTLNSLGNGTIFQTVSIPPLTENCRFAVHYYYLANSTSIESTEFVGSARLLVDGVERKRFQIFAYLQQVLILTSNTRSGILLGDAFQLEQIATDLSISTIDAQITVELTVDNTHARRLYFLEPSLHCASGVATGRATTSEINALNRFYSSLFVSGVTRPLLNWRKADGSVNGDPCTNLWQGVQCRHNRVVGLHFEGMNLTGTVPLLPELAMLEELLLPYNNIVGGLRVNNSRLRRVVVSNNKIATLDLSNGIMAFRSHRCLVQLQASHNLINAFPTEVTSIPSLIELDLSFNNISDVIPKDFSALHMLKVLHLSTNKLYGTLPAFVPSNSLVSIDFSHNRFSGTIPSSWNSLRNCLFLDVSKNNITGTIPFALAEIRTGNDLVFRAEDNFLSGIIPRLSTKLLDLRGNFFECPMMRPEIETNTSEMDTIAMWGVSDWCDYQSARAGY